MHKPAMHGTNIKFTDMVLKTGRYNVDQNFRLGNFGKVKQLHEVHL
jgi:hypothetical protein